MNKAVCCEVVCFQKGGGLWMSKYIKDALNWNDYLGSMICHQFMLLQQNQQHAGVSYI